MDYRCFWIPRLGYTVYRHFDDLKCSTERMAETHMVATFVSDAEGEDYCAYRNEMMEKRGTDELAPR